MKGKNLRIQIKSKEGGGGAAGKKNIGTEMD